MARSFGLVSMSGICGRSFGLVSMLAGAGGPLAGPSPGPSHPHSGAWLLGLRASVCSGAVLGLHVWRLEGARRSLPLSAAPPVTCGHREAAAPRLLWPCTPGWGNSSPQPSSVVLTVPAALTCSLMHIWHLAFTFSPAHLLSVLPRITSQVSPLLLVTLSHDPSLWKEHSL